VKRAAACSLGRAQGHADTRDASKVYQTTGDEEGRETDEMGDR